MGYIDHIQVLGENWRADFPRVAATYEGYMQNVRQEIRDIHGDLAGLGWDEFFPVGRTLPLPIASLEIRTTLWKS